jgi:hypothetical protein
MCPVVGKMDSIPGVWDAFSQISAELQLDSQTSRVYKQPEDAAARRKSLLPPPLRLRPSPAPTPTPRSQTTSPPHSPSPTVFVSLRFIEPSELNPLSLHDYRKTLSSPQPDTNASQDVPRTLKRKPKALNLRRGPLSPPETPSTSPFSSSVSLVGDLASTSRCLSPETELVAARPVFPQPPWTPAVSPQQSFHTFQADIQYPRLDEFRTRSFQHQNKQVSKQAQSSRISPLAGFPSASLSFASPLPHSVLTGHVRTVFEPASAVLG